MSEKSFEEVLDDKGFLCDKNVGISMLPLIRQGRDVVVIRKKADGKFKKYDAVLYRRPGVVGRGAYILHRILKVNPDGTYWIVGDNCCTGETVKEENILGILTEVVRDGKKVSVDDKKYKIYVHIWCDFYPIRFFFIRLKWKLVPLKSKIKSYF